MKLVACLVIIVAITSAWDPVRPGALIRRVGDLIIVNQNVRIKLTLENVSYIKENIANVQQGLELAKLKLADTNIHNGRLKRKIHDIEDMTQKIERFFKVKRGKRAIAIAMAFAALAGLSIANAAWSTQLHYRTNTLEYSFERIDELQMSTDELKDSIVSIEDALMTLDNNTNYVRDTLEVFLLLDQLYIKTVEIKRGIEQLIQDLVLANTGVVTSTLLPITKLIHIINTAKIEWNFTPFFNAQNAALYYPILSSYLNGTSVIIDIPFSSELEFHIYNIIPFPMMINQSTLMVNTQITEPINYILSKNNLKESTITTNQLRECRKTNINLYLCPATTFTLSEALKDSCAASLVKNVTVYQTCKFNHVESAPRHETVQESHYIFFPNQTTVSIVCPNINTKVVSVQGLHKVPDQCELHSHTITTIANRRKTLEITQKNIITNIDITLPNNAPSLKINHMTRRIIHKEIETSSNMTTYIFIAIFIVILILTIGCAIYVYKKMADKKVNLKHVSR